MRVIVVVIGLRVKLFYVVGVRLNLMRVMIVFVIMGGISVFI